jgi:hypothetical protein
MSKEEIQQLASYLNPEPVGKAINGFGNTVLIVNEHQKVVEIDNDNLPDYIDDCVHLSTLDSFVAYVSRFGDQHTFVHHQIGDKEAFQVLSVIDYHDDVEPARCKHKAYLRIVPTIEYAEIFGGIDSGEMTQRVAVQYLERIQHLVQAPSDDPDAPTAAEIGALLRNLAVTANKSASIKTDTDGNVQNLKFVAVKVFEELNHVGIKIKPSVKVDDNGRVTVTFRAPALKVIWRDANDELKAMLRKQLDATIKVRVYE